MAWIDGIDEVAGTDPVAASSDASFRRYFRLVRGDESFIVMDAPPPAEDCRPFVAVAGYLTAMRLNAPRVLAADLEQGFLLLSDLGKQQYLEILREEPEHVRTLYEDAIDALLTMQRRGAAYQSLLPSYDKTLLEFELSLFRDWLCGTHLGLAFSRNDEKQWQRCCDRLVESALEQPTVFVHRDYHSRNLMRTSVDNPGILDFQDAVEGPLTYDLVSLLKDCYITWPQRDVKTWAKRFYAGLDRSLKASLDAAAFQRAFDMMGVQRHLKAAGIFCRLNHRDNKSAYLDDVPRTLSYITALTCDYPELDFLTQLIERDVLPAWGVST